MKLVHYGFLYNVGAIGVIIQLTKRGAGDTIDEDCSELVNMMRMLHNVKCDQLVRTSMANDSVRFSFNLGAKGNCELRRQIAKIRQINPLAKSMSNPNMLSYLAGVGAQRELERLQGNPKSEVRRESE